MTQRMLKSRGALILLCFFLTAIASSGQGFGPFIGDLTPCPGTSSYSITGNHLFCNQTEYEIEITPIDENGNEIFPGYQIATGSMTAFGQMGGLEGELQNWPVGTFYFDINWITPNGTQFRRARVCFRARCVEVTPQGTLLDPAWQTRCVTVEIEAIDRVTITGPQQIECCALEPITYCASPSNYSSYNWSIPAGWTIQGASNGACITVVPNGTGGTITAKPWHAACSTWGLPTFHSVTTTTCTRGSIEVLQPVPCNGSANGSIRAVAPAGFSISGIAWRDQNGNIVGQGQTTLTGLAPGTYTAEMVLNNGCIAQESIYLSGPQDDQPLDIDFSTSRYDPEAWKEETSDCMYTIRATPRGGLAPYTFRWSGFPSNDDLWYLNTDGGTTVTLTITDARGCVYTESFNVPTCPGIHNNDISDLAVGPNPNQGVFTASVVTTANGVLDFRVFDIYNNSVYSYTPGQINSGSYNYQLDISNKPNGLYFLTATLNGVDPVSIPVVKQ